MMRGLSRNGWVLGLIVLLVLLLILTKLIQPGFGASGSTCCTVGCTTATMASCSCVRPYLFM